MIQVFTLKNCGFCSSRDPLSKHIYVCLLCLEEICLQTGDKWLPLWQLSHLILVIAIIMIFVFVFVFVVFVFIFVFAIFVFVFVLSLSGRC